jgi:hypothetical protein
VKFAGAVTQGSHPRGGSYATIDAMEQRPITKGQFIVAKIGSRTKRKMSLALLIAGSDLPGSAWIQRSERAFRIGKLGPAKPWSVRARDAGLFTAFRAFKQDSSKTWVMSQVIPLVSIQDAILAVEDWTTKDALKFQGLKEAEDTEIPDVSIRGADLTRCISRVVQAPGGPRFALVVLVAVKSVMILQTVSIAGNPITFEDVVPFASAQVTKVSANPNM